MAAIKKGPTSGMKPRPETTNKSGSSIGNIYGMYVRYVLLDQLIIPQSQITTSNKPTKIHFFIDVKTAVRSIFKYLSKDDIIEPVIKRELIEEISSQFANLIAHYRFYYESKHDIKTMFHWLYSNKPCERYRSVFKGHKKKYYEKYDTDNDISEVIAKSMGLFELLNKYIPDSIIYDTSEYDEYASAIAIFKNNVEDTKFKHTFTLISDDTNFIIPFFVMEKEVGKNILKPMIIDPRSHGNTKLFTSDNVLRFIDIEGPRPKTDLILKVMFAISVAGTKYSNYPAWQTYGFKRGWKLALKLFEGIKIVNGAIDPESSKFISYPLIWFPTQNSTIYSKGNTKFAEYIIMNILDEPYNSRDHVTSHISAHRKFFTTFMNLVDYENVANEDPTISEVLNVVKTNLVDIQRFVAIDNKFFISFPINVSKILLGYLM